MVAQESRSLHPELLMQRLDIFDITSFLPGTTHNISRLKKQYLPCGLAIDRSIAYFRGQLNSQDTHHLTYGTVSFPSKHIQQAKKVCPGGWMSYWGQSNDDEPMLSFHDINPLIYWHFTIRIQFTFVRFTFVQVNFNYCTLSPFNYMTLSVPFTFVHAIQINYPYHSQTNTLKKLKSLALKYTQSSAFKQTD